MSSQISVECVCVCVYMCVSVYHNLLPRTHYNFAVIIICTVNHIHDLFLSGLCETYYYKNWWSHTEYTIKGKTWFSGGSYKMKSKKVLHFLFIQWRFDIISTIKHHVLAQRAILSYSSPMTCLLILTQQISWEKWKLASVGGSFLQKISQLDLKTLTTDFSFMRDM